MVIISIILPILVILIYNNYLYFILNINKYIVKVLYINKTLVLSFELINKLINRTVFNIV